MGKREKRYNLSSVEAVIFYVRVTLNTGLKVILKPHHLGNFETILSILEAYLFCMLLADRRWKTGRKSKILLDVPVSFAGNGISTLLLPCLAGINGFQSSGFGPAVTRMWFTLRICS